MIVTVLLNALLALPVFAGCRRLLRPVLVVDPLELRRRRQRRRARPARSACGGWRSGMYLDNDSRRPTLTPQLALRVAIIGGIALVAFAVVFFRLWYLQVLSGDKYEAEAKGNQRAQDQGAGAARGDRGPRGPRAGGQPHRPGGARSRPTSCPRTRRARARSTGASAKLLGMRAARIERRVDEQLKALPFSPATVKQDVPQTASMYIVESQEDFRGVDVEQVFLREYPHGEIGAHLFGYVGEITKEQLDDPRYRGVDAGRPRRPAGHRGRSTTASCAGATARRRCRWTPSATCAASSRDVRPEQGRQLRLSVDLDVQRVGQQALAGGTARAPSR